MKRAKKLTLEEIQSVRCPTCSAAPEEVCELHTGGQRSEPHDERALIADKLREEAVNIHIVTG